MSGEFHTNPWIVLPGWGSGVLVWSPADLDSVRTLLADPDVPRRAVLFPNLTARKRRALTKSIEERGVILREFTKNDNEAMRIRPQTVKDRLVFWGAIALGTPILVVDPAAPPHAQTAD